MTLETRFKVNAPTVTHETIEGESVIINLETGNYYSLQGTGAAIWASVVRNRAVSEIVEDISQQYAGARVLMEESINRLLTELRSEQLIVPDGSRGGDHDSGDLLVSLPLDKAEFQSPELHKFTDMQELLLLDPIHEVDAAGWPSAKQDS